MASLKILFVTGGSPWPPNIGVNQRTNLLLRALKGCGDVDTVINSPFVEFSTAQREYVERQYSVVGKVQPRRVFQRWPWRAVSPLSPRLAAGLAYYLGGVTVDYKPDRDSQKWLTERLNANRYDLIVGRYLRSTATSGALEYGPVILDLDDFDTGVLKARLESPNLSMLRRSMLDRRIGKLEHVVGKLLDRCSHIWVASDADEKLLHGKPVSVLPNIPFVPEGAHAPEPCRLPPEGSTILIVGSLRHDLNVRGIDSFVVKQWPSIRRAFPLAEFRIVGVGMTEEQRSRWKRIDGVVPVGFVEDLRDEYQRCAFTLVPLFEGGGTKIKILESLMYGRTCVITRHAHRGYEDVLQHRDSLWVAEDEDGLIQGCLALLGNLDLCSGMARRGHQLVTTHYSFERFKSVVEDAVERVMSGGAGSQKRIGESVRRKMETVE